MNTPNEIKVRYAEEAITYRKEAPLVNFDAKKLFIQLINITNKIFPDTNAKIKVLDIGAGNGILTELIINKYPNAEITMLDFSPEMLESAKSYFEKQNLNVNVKYIISNFITDNLPNESFDLIISSYALHHIRTENELENIFLKIANTLKENIGTFLCVDMYLGTGESQRNNQVKKAIDKWTDNFGTKERANEWGMIIKQEDTPATIPTIISLLNKCSKKNLNTIPLLTNHNGVLATLYGMTKIPIEEIHKLKLYDLVQSWKDNTLPIGATENEHKIGTLPFNEPN